MLNSNLMNPTNVSRIAREREQELRRTFCELSEDENKFEQPNAPKAKTQTRHNYTHFAWLHAFMMR